MDQVRVNITLEKGVWEAFNHLVPQRKKSKRISELLKQEIENINRRKEREAFALAFKEASRDKRRLAEIQVWTPLDSEEWD